MKADGRSVWLSCREERLAELQGIPTQFNLMHRCIEESGNTLLLRHRWHNDPLLVSVVTVEPGDRRGLIESGLVDRFERVVQPLEGFSNRFKRRSTWQV